MLENWPLIARFVLGGFVASIGAVSVPVAGYILKDAWDAWKAKSQPMATTDKQVEEPAALLFKCDTAKLPSTVPASGKVWTMDIISKLEVGAEPWGISRRHGEPGEKWTWFKDYDISQVWRCDITNYAEFPIFNVAMVFKEVFRTAVASKDNPNALSSGDTVDTSDRTVVLDNIDAKSTLSFYAYSQSRHFVSVSIPKEVTYLRAGRDTREMATILPVVFGGMSFAPKPEAPKHDATAAH